ncbi:OLC1v1018966C1 [Oldenlandia corymbosa var. corymbosa]|uniref:OLC1v1018966C1 n=1 Tax=Oldenlandia corymbosa var. corymbosa TaxID=529605 RepID=A0AAV1ECV1_OLDCO|nr:OLC1v1018966C1 [Oldenlandia corymbosa var. corymbosa]
MKQHKEQASPASDKGSKKSAKVQRGQKGTPKDKTTQKGQPKKRKSRQDEDNPLLTRVSSHAVCDFVGKLDDVQKKVVRKIDFGHLLDIKFERFDDTDLCRYLLENYDPQFSRIIMQENQVLTIDEADVEAVLGLPRGQYEVVDYIEGKTNEDYTRLVEKMRITFGLDINRGGPAATKVMNHLVGGRMKKKARIRTRKILQTVFTKISSKDGSSSELYQVYSGEQDHRSAVFS